MHVPIISIAANIGIIFIFTSLIIWIILIPYIDSKIINLEEIIKNDERITNICNAKIDKLKAINYFIILYWDCIILFSLIYGILRLLLYIWIS